MTATVRKHFVLPKELAEEFEREAGERQQSERVAELIDAWLKTRRMKRAFAALAETTPSGRSEWDDMDPAEWVRSERAKWDRGAVQNEG
jgi:hypothetical protein